MRRTAALILGGGPAGAAAALSLAAAGRRALLIERSRETPDALCGGFLSWRTLGLLDGMGIAVPGATVRRLRLFADGTVAETDLPGRAVGLSRRTLDTLLLDVAAARGACIERGVQARSSDGCVLRLADGASLRPDALFLAVGKHDLRGLGRPRATGDAATGLRLHLRPPPPLIGDAIELHLFDRGYAGVVMQEDGRANLCMAVAKSLLAECDGDPARLLTRLGEASPALGDRLAWRDDDGIDAIGAVPYGWRARQGRAGLFRLGDQAAVIPSLAGEGVGIALASGRSAAAAWLRGGAEAAIDWQKGFATQAARPLAVAGALRGLSAGRAAPALVRLAAALPPLARLLAAATRLPRGV